MNLNVSEAHWRAHAPKGRMRSFRERSLSALWKAGSGFPDLPWASEAAPLLRAFTQVPSIGCARRAQWPTSAAMVAAYHPLPKTKRAAIGRCASRVP